MSFQVQTETFQGPFDLLLQLILKDDVDLYEVRLSDIVDAYLAELARIEACNLEMATEFLLIAATLVELKCRRLLPVDDSVDLDEELAIWEERDMLLARLLECKTFKDAAKILEGLMSQASLSVPRKSGLEDQFLELTPDLLVGVTGDKLKKAFIRATRNKPVPEFSLFHVTQVKASVTETIFELTQKLPSAGVVSFKELTADLGERLEIVVHFLAVLELFKQGLVELNQMGAFGDVQIEWLGGDPGQILEDLSSELVAAGSDLYEG